MFATTHNRWAVGAVTAFGMFVTATALAGDRHHCRKVDAELDLSSAELLAIDDGWLLTGEYEADFEDTCPQDRFVLTLHLRECGRRVCDDNGQVRTVLIPLDRPTDCDDGDLEFESRFEVRLPLDLIRTPDDLTLAGAVTFDGYDRPLDCDDTDVKYCAPCVEVCEPAAVQVIERPAPVIVAPAPRAVEVVRPAPRVVEVVRPVRRVIVRERYGPRVHVVGDRHGGFVDVDTDRVQVHVDGRW